MRLRSIRFFVIDLNTDFHVALGVSSTTLPMMLVYPAFHKASAVYQYEGDLNAIKISRFLYNNVDIKFKWKKKIF